MEETKRRSAKAWMLVICLMLSFFGRTESLSVTVNNVECVYEYVLYEGDTVTGNFVVVDHDIFWNSDHPGIDLTVSATVSYVIGAFASLPHQGHFKPFFI